MPVKKKPTPKAETKPVEAKTEETKQTQPKHTSKRLTKSSSDKVIFGVAGGIAEYLEIDPVIIRALFVLLAFFGGPGVVIYIILAIILPEKGSENKSTREVVEENAKGFEKTAENFASEAENIAKTKNTKLWIGILVIVLGCMLFISNLQIWDFGRMIDTIARFIWPLIIVGIGVYLLTRNQDD